LTIQLAKPTGPHMLLPMRWKTVFWQLSARQGTEPTALQNFSAIYGDAYRGTRLKRSQ